MRELKDKKGRNSLTFFESSMLICGSGLGTGILAVPYIMSKMGVLEAFFAVMAAGAVTALSHLMVADLAIHSADSTQLLGIFQQHLFRGKGERSLTAVFFVILVTLLLLNLTLYLVCAADVLTDSFPISDRWAKALFYAGASLLVALGIKSIGLSEKYSMLIIGCVVVGLGLLALPALSDAPGLSLMGCFGVDNSSGGIGILMVLYSICMFSFSALFAVPQVVHYIEDKSKIKKSVLWGIGTNSLITFAFALIVTASPGEVTQVATLGLSAQFGKGVKWMCSLFVLLAMLTSFLSIALAQIEVICEKTKLRTGLAWFLATFPALITASVLPLSFLSYVEIVGGVVAVIVAVMVLPSYVRSVKGTVGKDLLLGIWGKKKSMVIGVFCAYLIMAAGALITVN